MTGCLSAANAAAAAAFTLGSSHFLISKRTWIQPQSCSFTRLTRSRFGCEHVRPQGLRKWRDRYARRATGRRRETREGTRWLRDILSFTALTEMMSAANEFPSRALLPWWEEKQNAPSWAARTGADFLLDGLCWPEGRSAANTDSTFQSELFTLTDKTLTSLHLLHCRHKSCVITLSNNVRFLLAPWSHFPDRSQCIN